MTKQRSKTDIIISIVVVLLMSAGIFLFGSFLALTFLFSGRLLYFYPMVATFVFFIAFLFAHFVFLKKIKALNYILVGCLVVFLGVVIYKESNILYDNYVGSVSAEVNLWQYRPFYDDSKAVSLNEAATLQLSDNLPRIDGATALYPLYAAFVQAVYPKGDYPPYSRTEPIVVSSKTGKAYDRLFDNQTNIIFVAGPSDEQVARAESLGLTMQLTPIGYEAFVFFVNKSNPIDNLSIAQIQGIYSGQLTHWQEISPQISGKIIPFQRPKNSGSQSALERIMGDTLIITPIEEEVVSGMGGIIERTAEYKNYKKAIGYSYLFFASSMVANDKIKIVNIDGIAANHASIKDKTYPFAAAFYAVTIKEHNNNANIERFIEWILSAQGQKLVEKTGYVPL